MKLTDVFMLWIVSLNNRNLNLIQSTYDNYNFILKKKHLFVKKATQQILFRWCLLDNLSSMND